MSRLAPDSSAEQSASLQLRLDRIGETIADLKLLRKQALELSLPINPIDKILLTFGHDSVAELTGRSHQMFRTRHGKFEYRRRSKGEKTRADEAKAFQSGEKRIAVVSKACSSGISLHASR